MQVVDHSVDIAAVLGHGAEDDVEVVDDRTDEFVAVGEGTGQGAGGREELLDVTALALEHRDDGLGELVDLVRVEGPK